jgi:hypothetical protein
MANAAEDEILIGGNFKVDIQGCASSADCVSADVDDIEIEIHDVTQSNNTNWRANRSGVPRFGQARFTFRTNDAQLNSDLRAWVNDTRMGKNIRKPISLFFMARDQSTIGRTYTLENCFPVSFTSGDFTVGGEANVAELVVQPTRVLPA